MNVSIGQVRIPWRAVAGFLLLLIFLISAVIWYFGYQPPTFARWLPADVPALLVINRLPENLDFLEQTPIADWAEVDSANLARLAHQRWSTYSELFDQGVREAWIAIHGLERKPDGALRIHFTAILVPQMFRLSPVRAWIEEKTRARFEQATSRRLEETEVTEIRGSQPGQLLYLAEREGALVVSNTELGRLIASGEMTASSLDEDPQFERARGLGVHRDIFLLVRGSRLLSVFPDFAYALDIEEGGTESRGEYLSLK